MERIFFREVNLIDGCHKPTENAIVLVEGTRRVR